MTNKIKPAVMATEPMVIKIYEKTLERELNLIDLNKTKKEIKIIKALPVLQKFSFAVFGDSQQTENKVIKEILEKEPAHEHPF